MHKQTRKQLLYFYELHIRDNAAKIITRKIIDENFDVTIDHENSKRVLFYVKEFLKAFCIV